jgi:DNA ligase-associated metallophosphoesterase
MNMANATMQAETVIALGGVDFIADVSGALFEPETRTLIVADCHFEKGSAFSRLGHILPPFDTRDTLIRLEAVASRFRPKAIVSLGDGFHDRAAALRLSEDDVARLHALARMADLVWIAGNHDPEPVAALPGDSMLELALAGIMLRHAPGGMGEFEIAGHLHPAAKIAGRGRSVRRRCFVSDGRRCILPAFGAYTGGLNILDEAFAPLLARETWRIHALGRERLYGIAPALLVND